MISIFVLSVNCFVIVKGKSDVDLCIVVIIDIYSFLIDFDYYKDVLIDKFGFICVVSFIC